MAISLSGVPWLRSCEGAVHVRRHVFLRLTGPFVFCLYRRWAARGAPMVLVSRNLGRSSLGSHCITSTLLLDHANLIVTLIVTHRATPGNELRAADPNSTDVDLSRDLGYGAVKFLIQGGTGCMVALEVSKAQVVLFHCVRTVVQPDASHHCAKSGKISAIPLSKILDPQTGRTQIRLVDTQSLQYEVAREYMIRLGKSDLQNVELLAQCCRVARLSQADFIKRFEHVAQDDL